MQLTRTPLLVTLCAALLWTACDSATGDSGTRIGPRGGTLTSADGALTLEVPPNALDEEVGLTVERMPDPADGVPGTYYDFGPDGTRFAAPARLTLAVDPPAGVALTSLSLAHVGEEGDLQLLPTTADVAAGTLSADVHHFSGYRAVDARCVPGSGQVMARLVEGDQIEVTWDAQAGVQVEVAQVQSLTVHESDYRVWIRQFTASGTRVYPNPGVATAMYFRVRTRCGGVLSATASAPARVFVFAPATPPERPLSLTAHAWSATEVSLYWGGGAGTFGYEVQRVVTGRSDWQTVGFFPGTDWFHLDGAPEGVLGALLPDTTYSYRIRATNAVGESPWLNATVTTSAASAPTTPTGPSVVGSCPQMKLTVTPGAVQLGTTDTAELVVDVTRGADFESPIYLTVEVGPGLSDWIFPSFCVANAEGPGCTSYSAQLGEGEVGTRRVVVQSHQAIPGMSGPVTISAPEWPGCEVRVQATVN